MASQQMGHRDTEKNMAPPQNLWDGIKLMTLGFACQGACAPRTPCRVHGITV